MLESSIIYALVRTLPESIVLILCGMILLGVKIDKSELFKYGVLLGITISIIRALPINFGVHTILSMIAFGLIIFKCFCIEAIRSMIVTCEVWIALVLSEGIYVLIATELLNIKVETLMNTTKVEAAIITLPSLLIIIAIVYLFRIAEDKLKSKALRG